MAFLTLPLGRNSFSNDFKSAFIRQTAVLTSLSGYGRNNCSRRLQKYFENIHKNIQINMHIQQTADSLRLARVPTTTIRCNTRAQQISTTAAQRHGVQTVHASSHRTRMHDRQRAVPGASSGPAMLTVGSATPLAPGSCRAGGSGCVTTRLCRQRWGDAPRSLGCSDACSNRRRNIRPSFHRECRCAFQCVVSQPVSNRIPRPPCPRRKTPHVPQ